MEYIKEQMDKPVVFACRFTLITLPPRKFKLTKAFISPGLSWTDCRTLFSICLPHKISSRFLALILDLAYSHISQERLIHRSREQWLRKSEYRAGKLEMTTS